MRKLHTYTDHESVTHVVIANVHTRSLAQTQAVCMHLFVVYVSHNATKLLRSGLLISKEWL